MKTFFQILFFFIFYMKYRILSIPLYWRGIPNFEYWIKDSEKSASQIKMIFFIEICTLMFWLFGLVIGSIFTTLWIAVGIFYVISLKSKNNQKWKEHSHL